MAARPHPIARSPRRGTLDRGQHEYAASQQLMTTNPWQYLLFPRQELIDINTTQVFQAYNLLKEDLAAFDREASRKSKRSFMHCSEANQQLQYYVDGQLPIPQIHLLEAHISSCTACQNELRLLQEVVDRLHDLQSVAEPTYMTMRIMERVAMCPQRTRKADRD